MSGDGRPCMPQSWNLTHVALIPKPGKKHGAISSLRPIGLQDPIAKGYVKVLADDLKPYAMSYLRGKPQHAYLAHRSTYSAIIQAADHCRRARGLLRAHTHNLHQRREGTIKRGDFCACLQISVDLSQAFDTAPWELIHESLRRARAPPALINRIMDWISGTTYVLEHRGSKVEVRAQRGVRQGCVLSPLLWSLFTGLIYEEFQCLIDHDSVQPEVVFFADDKHLSWILDQPSQLVGALRQFGSFIQLLRTFGLQVNSTKSNAIMSLRGSMSQSLRKLWTSTFQGREWLRVPIGQDNEFIPLVQQLDYLGIVLSYGSFEELSWKRRIGVARASFERIRKILLGHHVLSLPHRVKLWKTIVLPSATYGPLGIGWSSPGFTRMHGMCMKQLRMIARSPVHLTSETNVHLLQRLGVQELGDHFAQMTSNALAYHQQLVEDLSSEDVMCRPVYVSWYSQLLKDLYTGRMMSPTDCEHLSPDLPSVHACEFCDQTFDDVRSLRIHQRKSHRDDLPEDWNRCQVTLETVRMHAVDGMPTCAYCLFKFANWRNLFEHLLQSRCQILASHATSVAQPAGAPAAQPWVQNSELIQSIRHSGLGVLRRSHSSLQELQHHCCLCRQWFVHPDYAASHYKKTHGALWEVLGNRVRALVRPHCLSAACLYCGKVPTRKAKHKCPVLTQAYFALLVDERRAGSCPADESRNQLLSESLSSALPDAEGKAGADGYKGPAQARDIRRYFHSGRKSPQGHEGRDPGWGQQSTGTSGTSSFRVADARQDSSGEPTHTDTDHGISGQYFDTSATAPGWKHHHTACEGQVQERQAGQGSRQRTEGKQRTLSNYFQLQSSGQCHLSDGAPVFAPRRRDRSAACEPRIRLVAEDSWTRIDSAIPSQGVGSMESQEGRGGCAGSSASDSHAIDLAGGDDREGSGCSGTVTFGGLGPSGSHPESWGRTLLAVSTLEPHPTRRGDCVERRNATPGAFETDEETQSGQGHDHAREHLTLPRLPLHHRKHDGGHLAPTLGNRDSGRGSAESSCMASADGQLHSLEAYRRPLSSRAAGSLSTGQPSCRALGMNAPDSEGEVILLRSPSRFVAPSMVLANPHNLCYANTVAIAFTWLGHIFQSYVLAGGTCSGCLKVVYGARNLQITNALPWLAVFANWPQAHEQHDAAEFGAHFLHLARPRIFSGAWNARIAQGDTIRVTDMGPLLLPLKLDRLESTLQSCLDAWEGQAQVHALSHFDHALILQLHRFALDCDGNVIKQGSCIAIRPGQTVAVPVFSAPTSTETVMVSCRVAFIVYHLGDTQYTGHYQVALVVPGRCLGFSDGWKFLICNDSCKPRLATASDIRLIECNSYLIGLYRSGAD